MSVVVEDFSTFSPGFCWMGISSVSVAGSVSVESAVTVLGSLTPASISSVVTVWTQV